MLAKRLRGELELLGFSVILADPVAAHADRAALNEIARRSHAAIAVTAIPAAEGVEVSVLDRVTGKLLVREVLTRELGNENADGIVVVRVVELLRASLLEIALPHPSRGEIDPTPAVRRVAAVEVREAVAAPATLAHQEPVRARDQSFVDLGGARYAEFAAAVGASSNVATTGIATTLALEARWQTRSRLAWGLVALLPFGPATLTSGNESSNVYSSLLAGGARLRLSPSASRLVVGVGGGAALSWFHLSGTRAAGTHQLQSDDLWVAGPYVDASVGWCLSVTVCVMGAVRGVVAFPEPVVAFAGRDVGSLGRPLMAFTLGLEYRAVPENFRD